MIVKKAKPLAIECVVRGYLDGSGWKEYRNQQTVCGIKLPSGLAESAELPEPIFTPATKAETGHDVNISEEAAAAIVGRDLLARVKALTLEIFRRGCEHAESKGIIIADTKFEFGLAPASPSRRSAGLSAEARSAKVEGADADRSSANVIGDDEVILIDEVLTPDSSRFWPKDQYKPGGAVPSFDKQYVRDYLEEIRWNKQPPVPSLPEAVVLRTREKYVEAFRRLSGRDLQ